MLDFYTPMGYNNNVRRGNPNDGKSRPVLAHRTAHREEVVNCTPITGTKWTALSMRPSTKRSTEMTKMMNNI